VSGCARRMVPPWGAGRYDERRGTGERARTYTARQSNTTAEVRGRSAYTGVRVSRLKDHVQVRHPPKDNNTQCDRDGVGWWRLSYTTEEAMDIARTRARGSLISKKYVRVREGQKDVMERTTQSTHGKSAPKQQHNGGEGAQRGLVCAQSKGPRSEPTHMQ